MLPPRAELRVEDDLVVGTFPFESLEESEVRKLAFERRRSSLKNGMLNSQVTIRGCERFECKIEGCVAAQYIRLDNEAESATGAIHLHVLGDDQP